MRGREKETRVDSVRTEEAEGKNKKRWTGERVGGRKNG